MIIETKTADRVDLYKLLIGSVLPRPIAWVGSISADGVDNLAPFSFFNVASNNPPVISISFGNKPDGTRKDSLNNILATEYFSVSMVSHKMAEAMHDSSQAFAPEIDEFAALNVKKAKCANIAASKVAGAGVVFECKFRQLIEFGADSSSNLVLADVISIEVDDAIIDYPKIDMQKLDLVGRGSGLNYVTTRDVFSLIRK
ncbi:MAG: flavin reductase family protein [OCS116 cluster bacterium]|nr:flavin reductase family protein [OCS116 cluster bacterium]